MFSQINSKSHRENHKNITVLAGAVFLDGQLDYETQSTHNLTITCCDGPLCSASFNLFIEVDDVNEDFTVEPETVELLIDEEEVYKFITSPTIL